jgi:hypothetical protein
MVSSEFYFVNTVEMFYEDMTGVYGSNKSEFLQKYGDYPGINNFKNFLFFLGKNITFYDRTNTIKSPFNIKLLPGFELPTYEKTTISYGECCELRAKQLLEHAEKTNRELCIFYSGGIDSTCVVVSMLKVATKSQKKLINIMMSFESYCENKDFYENYISNNLKIIPSHSFVNTIGDPKYICVTAEGNDQLFGSWMMQQLIIRYGEKEIVHDELTHSKLMKYLNSPSNTLQQTEHYVNLLEQITLNAPVKIDTMSKFLWWCNLTLKWQCVYFRILSLVSAKTRMYVKPEDNYFMFFSTKEFQLWSMNNSDEHIYDTLKTYKYICKEYIFDFDKNENYKLNKIKIGSLPKICNRKPMAMAIDSNMNYYDIVPDSELLLNKNNSFIF